MEEVKKELAKISKVLANVYTKDDTSLKTMIKDVLQELKVDLLKSVQHGIDILEGKLFAKDLENDDLKEKLAKAQKDLEDQKEVNDSLRAEIHRDREENNEKLNDLEQQGRKNSIRLSGVPEEDDDDEFATTQVVLRMLNSRLKHIYLRKEDIDISHRLGQRVPNKTRQIIVKFVSRLTRNMALKERKNFKNSLVYINEDLTRINQHVLARVRKKMPDDVEIAWSRGGKIFYRNKADTTTVHSVPYKQYQHWMDLSWPEPTPKPKSPSTVPSGSTESSTESSTEPIVVDETEVPEGE